MHVNCAGAPSCINHIAILATNGTPPETETEFFLESFLPTHVPQIIIRYQFSINHRNRIMNKTYRQTKAVGLMESVEELK